MSLSTRLRAAALAVSMTVLGGCWGVWSPASVRPSSTEFRIEATYVPNAELVRVDTPLWQLGRHTFRPGVSNLLVLRRITSWTSDDSLVRGATDYRRRDRIVERLWITIPHDTPIGEELDLLQLNQNFLVGYDEAEIGETEDFYIQPFIVIGKLSLVEQRPDSVEIRMTIRVTPQRRTDWTVDRTIHVAAPLHDALSESSDTDETM